MDLKTGKEPDRAVRKKAEEEIHRATDQGQDREEGQEAEKRSGQTEKTAE